MRIDGVKRPKSAFLSVEKDMELITRELLKNERFKRLLFYNSKDAMERPNLTQEESLGLINKNIKIVPKLYVDGSVLSYVIINFDNFTSNQTNPEFRDNIIEFDIVCHFDQWQMNDFKLRPYRIAAEIDSMFDGKHLTGIGELEFVDCFQILLTSEYAGVCLRYAAIHGEEDKKPMASPTEQAKLEAEFYSSLK